MIKLKKLTVSDFRSFKGTHEIDFSFNDKLVQINGRNELTGGSSGAGKSSIFMALDYLFGTNDIPTTQLQNRDSKNGLKVIGEFELDGKNLIIERSKKNGLKIIEGNEEYSGNSKITEEKLDSILKIQRKLFKKIIHKKQKEGGFFLNLTPKEMNTFLSNALGLDRFKLKKENITEKIKLDKKKEIELESKISFIKETEVDIENYIGKENSSIDVTKLQNRIEKANNTIFKLQDIKKRKEREIEEKYRVNEKAYELKAEIQKLQDIKKDLNNKKNDLESKILENKNNLNKIELYRDKLKEVANELKQLINEKETLAHKKLCPKCRRPWDVGLEEELNKVNLLIEKGKKKALEIKQFLDKESVFKAEISENEEKVFNLNKDIDKLNKSIETRELKFRKIYEETRVLENNERKKLDKYDLRIERLRWYLEEKKNLLIIHDKEVEKIKKAKKLQELMLELDKIKEEIYIYEEAKNVLDSYILYLFEDALDNISSIASNILEKVPNMENGVIYFETFKEKKDGSLKDEITPILNINGVKTPIKSLSGGEATTVQLALDLAVISIIEERNGIGTDFYFIDEPFDGLDSISKENYLEVLKTLDVGKRIFIVDHSEELKEMVNKEILVVKDNNGSHIK